LRRFLIPFASASVDLETGRADLKVPLTEASHTDQFTFFTDAIKKSLIVEPSAFFSIERNATVVEILEAARESNRTGNKTILPGKDN
jgi:hypothetical protein